MLFVYAKLLACESALASANAEDPLGRHAEYHNADIKRKMRCLASQAAHSNTCVRPISLAYVTEDFLP
jgi:hypothetical protein